MENNNDKPLCNFDNYLALFKLFQIGIEENKDIHRFVKEGIFNRLEYKDKAIDDIKKLIFLNGNGTERMIKYIGLEFEKIRKGFEVIQETNKIIKPTLNLPDEIFQKYIKTIDSKERDFYNDYSQMTNEFLFHFFNELIELGILEKQKKIKLSKSLVPENKNYTQRQIAIAYFFMGTVITLDNAKDILKEHSKTKSIQKLISKRISKASTLNKLSENKTVDTKHKNDLLAAKRLISGIKNQTKALTDIDCIINTFELKYNELYYKYTTR